MSQMLILLKCDFNPADLSDVFFLYWQAKSTGQMRAPSERRESKESQQQTPQLGISDFMFLQVLGKGSFGKVGMTRVDNEKCSVTKMWRQKNLGIYIVYEESVSDTI